MSTQIEARVDALRPVSVCKDRRPRHSSVWRLSQGWRGLNPLTPMLSAQAALGGAHEGAPPSSLCFSLPPARRRLRGVAALEPVLRLLLINLLKIGSRKRYAAAEIVFLSDVHIG